MLRIATTQWTGEAWTPEVDLIMSSLDAAWEDAADRRTTPRMRFRVVATLRLYADLDDSAPWTLFIRDVHTRGAGFITKQRLPLGYGGRLQIVGPDGRELDIACTVLRCRPCVNNWFEGALSFNRPQDAFQVVSGE